jgi:hypothetical protein
MIGVCPQSHSQRPENFQRQILKNFCQRFVCFPSGAYSRLLSGEPDQQFSLLETRDCLLADNDSFVNFQAQSHDREYGFPAAADRAI